MHKHFLIFALIFIACGGPFLSSCKGRSSCRAERGGAGSAESAGNAHLSLVVHKNAESVLDDSDSNPSV